LNAHKIEKLAGKIAMSTLICVLILDKCIANYSSIIRFAFWLRDNASALVTVIRFSAITSLGAFVLYVILHIWLQSKNVNFKKTAAD